jgi:large subunit ribosomal protein L28
MSRVCEFTGKGGLVGNRVSHANNKTKVRLQTNIQSKRIWVPSLKKFVRLKLSTEAIRSISKLGIEAYARKAGVSLV